MKIQATGFDPGDWIRANSVLKKAHLCFKLLRIQGPLDPICLGSEVQIREEDQGLYKVQIRQLRLRLTLSLSPKLRFSLSWPPKPLARVGAMFSV